MKFDDNGFAIESGIFEVFNFSHNDGSYVGCSTEWIAQGFGLPGFSTLKSPPPADNGFVARFFDGEWEVVPNHVGKTIYSTSSKHPSIVERIGEIPQGYTLDEPGEFDAWVDGAWVCDDDAKNAKAEEQNSHEKAMLISYANQRISILTDATDPDIVGDVDPEDIETLKQWKIYRVMVSKVDAKNPVWPDKPE